MFDHTNFISEYVIKRTISLFSSDVDVVVPDDYRTYTLDFVKKIGDERSM